ncbi:acid phosphatase 1-like [Prosopis cineraria]|uniref:acid phosphatase 1-like n=1 Tax=Prosopis cineraria TaxID=364024 RepID=UPI002410944B|nr:acid phosphatase 1-like [Prosopis cineraria]
MEAWMKESKAPAIEETVGLFHEIRNRGIQIFLVSSRKETLRPATVDNLIKVGFHGWTRLILRGLEEEIMEVGKYKSRVRQRLVEEEGYRIWGIVGDQWSSFHGRPSAHSTFKLPNSIYYLSYIILYYITPPPPPTLSPFLLPPLPFSLVNYITYHTRLSSAKSPQPFWLSFEY